jgi:hypothetical protein
MENLAPAMFERFKKPDDKGLEATVAFLSHSIVPLISAAPEAKVLGITISPVKTLLPVE